LDHPLLKVIQGDPTESAVLEQVNARQAKSAIILADRENGDPNAADARNLLIVLAIETLQPDIYSCVEVLNPDNKKHFARAGVDEVISVSEISNHLVVQAALNPGVSNLISDMLSFGKGEEIYEKPVPPAFVGKTFADLATVLMRERDMVLIGVQSNGEIVTSNRTRWQFKKGDMVFVLAEDEPIGLEEVAVPA
jgi:voltage-gated potassium channel